jgi:hypothetical protein
VAAGGGVLVHPCSLLSGGNGGGCCGAADEKAWLQQTWAGANSWRQLAARPAVGDHTCSGQRSPSLAGSAAELRGRRASPGLPNRHAGIRSASTIHKTAVTRAWLVTEFKWLNSPWVFAQNSSRHVRQRAVHPVFMRILQYQNSLIRRFLATGYRKYTVLLLTPYSIPRLSLKDCLSLTPPHLPPTAADC